MHPLILSVYLVISFQLSVQQRDKQKSCSDYAFAVSDKLSFYKKVCKQIVAVFTNN